MKYDYGNILSLLEIVERSNPNRYPNLKPIHDQAMLELNDIVSPPTEEELKARADLEKAAEDKKAAALAKAKENKEAEIKAKAEAAKPKEEDEPEWSPPKAAKPAERRI